VAFCSYTTKIGAKVLSQGVPIFSLKSQNLGGRPRNMPALGTMWLTRAQRVQHSTSHWRQEWRHCATSRWRATSWVLLQRSVRSRFYTRTASYLYAVISIPVN